MPTHWPGSLVDMDALYALARRYKLRVIEDAALVIGSRWRGRPVGAIGDLVTFSFHPNKNMTSIEGGAIVCNDVDEARRIEPLRFHGIERQADGTRDVAFPGGNSICPTSMRASASRNSSGCLRSSRIGANWSNAISSVSSPTPRACFRRDRARTTDNHGTCSPSCCRSTA